jgi:hypothetical protein
MKKLALIILMALALMLTSCIIDIKYDTDTSTDSIIFSSDIDRPSDTDANVNTDTDSNINMDSDANTDVDTDIDIDTDTDASGDNKKCPPHNFGEYQEIAKPTCQQWGEYIRYCQDCNEPSTLTTEKTDHVFEILVKYIVEPTITSGGSGEYKCANCNTTEVRDLPPKLLDGVEGIIVEKIASKTIKITFSPVEGAQGYEIYYSGNMITEGNFNFAPKASAEIEGEEILSATFRVSLNIYQQFYIAVVPYVDGRHGEVICIKVE